MDEPDFVVLAPDPRQSRPHLTLVPKTHVSVLTDLSPDEMAAVLAGLSRTVLSLKQTYKVQDVQVRARPGVLPEADPHLRFDLVPKGVGTSRREEARGESMFPRS